MGELRLTFTIK